MTDASHGFWWQELKGVGATPLPFSVGERIAWYENQVRYHRTTNFILETVTIVVAAAIPAVTTVGAPVAVAGVLGAAVTILAGLRQHMRPGENRIRFSGTLVALQREAVLWSAGREPYNSDHADAVLIERVENLVAQETTQWADQHALRGSTQATDSPTR
jgi:hypothetical protein